MSPLHKFLSKTPTPAEIPLPAMFPVFDQVFKKAGPDILSLENSLTAKPGLWQLARPLIDTLFHYTLCLPDSRTNPPTLDGTLFLHSVKVTSSAVADFSLTGQVEMDSHGTLLMEHSYATKHQRLFALFFATLFHDIGKIFSWRVFSPTDTFCSWQPSIESLWDFSLRSNPIEFEPLAPPLSAEALNLFALSFLTPEHIRYLHLINARTQSPNLNALIELYKSFTTSDNPVGELIKTAHLSAIRDNSLSSTTRDIYNIQTIIRSFIRQVAATGQINKKGSFLYTTPEHTIAIFPRIFKEVGLPTEDLDNAKHLRDLKNCLKIFAKPEAPEGNVVKVSIHPANSTPYKDQFFAIYFVNSFLWGELPPPGVFAGEIVRVNDE